MLIAWKLSTQRQAVAAAAAIGCIWFVADWFTLGAPHAWVLVWNAAMRLIILVALGVIIGRLREALDNEQLLSRTDFLTSALNARAYAEIAQQEISRARRYRHALTVAFVDLDDFKRINDRLGHSHGDKVLKAAAKALRSSLRETDTLARIGGDEFVVLLPETSHEQAKKVLPKLQSAVAAMPLQGEGAITFSMGAVVFDPPPADLDELIRIADTVMYAVKSEGKNRLRIYSANDLPVDNATRVAGTASPDHGA
jgi:diguanylate cyclase (GGDEF)-like protein